MRLKYFILFPIMMIACLQTLWAQQQGMKVWQNGTFKGFVISNIDSIQFVNLATDVALSYNELTMQIGDTAKLTATVYPADVDKSVRWNSSNANVASVNDKGIVTALSPGTCTITCHVVDGINVEAECVVNVSKIEGFPITCAQAVEFANALEDGATSNDYFAVTGYITEVVGTVSRNQQTFWMADTKDGGRVFEAYWANLPDSVSEFVVGSKVKITGKLMKYVRNGEVTPEIKNAYVEILEEDDDSEEGGEQGDTSEYAINLSYTGGTNFYDNGVATINGVVDCKVLKIGTSKASGDFFLNVPAGKHSFYAIAWKGTDSANVVLRNGEEVIKEVTVQPNDGATAISPYTIAVTEADKYEFEVAADCTITVTSDKRVLFFGIK